MCMRCILGMVGALALIVGCASYEVNVPEHAKLNDTQKDAIVSKVVHYNEPMDIELFTKGASIKKIGVLSFGINLKNHKKWERTYLNSQKWAYSTKTEWLPVDGPSTQNLVNTVYKNFLDNLKKNSHGKYDIVDLKTIMQAKSYRELGARVKQPEEGMMGWTATAFGAQDMYLLNGMSLGTDEAYMNKMRQETGCDAFIVGYFVTGWKPDDEEDIEGIETFEVTTNMAVSAQLIIPFSKWADALKQDGRSVPSGSFFQNNIPAQYNIAANETVLYFPKTFIIGEKSGDVYKKYFQKPLYQTYNLLNDMTTRAIFKSIAPQK